MQGPLQIAPRIMVIPNNSILFVSTSTNNYSFSTAMNHNVNIFGDRGLPKGHNSQVENVSCRPYRVEKPISTTGTQGEKILQMNVENYIFEKNRSNFNNLMVSYL